MANSPPSPPSDLAITTIPELGGDEERCVDSRETVEPYLARIVRTTRRVETESIITLKDWAAFWRARASMQAQAARFAVPFTVKAAGDVFDTGHADVKWFRPMATSQPSQFRVGRLARWS
jgi:hypothetical protein